MKLIRIGLLGFGTVGKGIVDLLNINQHKVSNRTGYKLQVTDVAKRSWDDENLPSYVKKHTEVMSLVESDVDIIVEAIGGVEIAFQAVSKALSDGKHVVTANKALIAEKGEELLEIAKKNKVQLLFEAAVAGGVPIVRALKESFAGNQTKYIAGIINGTCNYILSAMSSQNRQFNDVLKEAQKLGYAEADPSFDIDGIDAAHKITILASIAFGIPLSFEKVKVEGIRNISPYDIELANELGYGIKHLGIANKRKEDDFLGLELRVHPTLVPKEHLLCQVNGVMNAVNVNDNAVGETLFYGAGAGSLPTASAVISDLISITKIISSTESVYINPLGFAKNMDSIDIISEEKHRSANYLRLQVEDKEDAITSITKILSSYNIDIDSLLQKEPKDKIIPVVIITRLVDDFSLIKAIKEIESFKFIKKRVLRIRLIEF